MDPITINEDIQQRKPTFDDILFSLDYQINAIEETKDFEEFKYLTLEDVMEVLDCDLTEEQIKILNPKIDQFIKVQFKYWQKE